MNDRFQKSMTQAMDLCKGMGTMAEKRGASPQAMAMAAANSLSSCLATAAMLQILMDGLTRSEAIASIKEHGTDLLANVMHQAIYKISQSDLPTLVKGYNEENPDHSFPELRPGWDN